MDKIKIHYDENPEIKKLQGIAITGIPKSFDYTATKTICVALGKLKASAFEAKSRNDMQRAFIYSQRFLWVFDYLKNYRKDSKEFLQVNNTVNIIKDFYKEIYEQVLQQKKTYLLEELQKEVDEYYLDSSIEPSFKAVVPLPCDKLKQLCEDDSVGLKLLLIDLRSEEEFSQLTLPFSEKLINIPFGVIGSLETLNNHFKDLKWKSWSNITQIVLFDEDSSFQMLQDKIDIKVLIEFLDNKIYNNEKKILCILDGGFTHWNKKYNKLSNLPMEENFIDNPLNILQNKPSENSFDFTITTNHNNLKTTFNGNSESNQLPSLSKLKVTEKDTVTSSTNTMNEEKKAQLKECTVPLVRLPVVDRTNKPKTSVSGNRTVDGSSRYHLLSNSSQNFNSVYSSNSSINSWDSWDTEDRETERKLDNKSTRNSIYPTLPDKKMVLMKIKTGSNELFINSQNKENNRPLEEIKTEPQKMEVDDSDDEKEKANSKYKNSPIKRSFSSPNLAQKPEQTPEYDRSLKPSVNVDRTGNNSFGGERLEPVYTTSSGNMPYGATGLKNLGNSCYMNSILQCLSNTPALNNYFVNNNYIKDLHNPRKTCVADQVAIVIKSLWGHKYKCITPRDLKKVIGKYKIEFCNSDQQDSHEFLTFLLDWIHNDLKYDSKDMNIDGESCEAKKQWDKAMNGKSSIISNLFYGQLRSTIECKNCGNKSITYEIFNSLTMSLLITKSKLEECLTRFTSKQDVQGWKCTHCREELGATKKFDFIKLSPVIVIHLNRFGEANGWLRKKETAVEFPSKNLDLGPYLHEDFRDKAKKYSYDLYAISNHYGSMEGGHYTAICRNPNNKWYKYDDQNVSEICSNSSINLKNHYSYAYLLFYISVQR